MSPRSCWCCRFRARGAWRAGRAGRCFRSRRRELAEDLGLRISPRGRLLAAALSGALALSVLDVWIWRADLPLIAPLLHIAPLAMLFTIFATSRICHAFNLIDGMNGLAGVTAHNLIALRAGLGGQHRRNRSLP
ncbi:MAG: hypothetical protein R3D53_08810 [Paracoccaceae bacterium]